MMDTEIIAKSPVRLTVAGMVMRLQLILRQEHAREVKQLPAQVETQQVLQWHWQNSALIP